MTTTATTPRQGWLVMTSPRSVVRLTLVALLIGAALAVSAGPSWAADGVVSSDPANGAALPIAPSTVELVFSAPIDLSQSHLAAQDGHGSKVTVGEPQRAAPGTLRLPITIRAAGDYTVGYHVVFQDGTEATGLLRFSVGTGVPPAPLGGAASAQMQQRVVGGHEHGVDPLSGTMLVADVAVLIGAIVLLLRKRAPGQLLANLPDDGAEGPRNNGVLG